MFPGHRARNVISSFYKKMKKPEDLSLTFLNTVLHLRCPALTFCFGAGKHKSGCAAVPNLFVAGVHVDAVNGEGLQAADLSATLLHLLLYKGKFLSRRLIIWEVSLRLVPVSRQQSVDGSSIGHTKQIPPSPVGRSGTKEMR